MSDTKHNTPDAATHGAEVAHSPEVIDARRREMAVEHLVFGTLGFLAKRHPELLDELDGSLEHLWDPDQGEARNDEAVRNIARRMLKSLRADN